MLYLFIRRLIKFKKASDHLKELKIELKQIYKDRELPRAKRLLRVEDDNGEFPASCRVSPIRSHPYGLVLQAFVSSVDGIHAPVNY